MWVDMLYCVQVYKLYRFDIYIYIYIVQISKLHVIILDLSLYNGLFGPEREPSINFSGSGNRWYIAIAII